LKYLRTREILHCLQRGRRKKVAGSFVLQETDSDVSAVFCSELRGATRETVTGSTAQITIKSTESIRDFEMQGRKKA
jgi:hypothetical protein